MNSRSERLRHADRRQTTLLQPFVLSGVGVHSNEMARLTVSPAAADTGVAFLRTDAPEGSERLVDAHWSNVSSTRLCTRIGVGEAGVSTVEHLMAALFGLGVDNALIEIDGPEVPAMDGSARAFVAAIEEAGLALLAAPRGFLQVVEPVRVSDGASFAEMVPWSGEGLHLDVEIVFPGRIGAQRLALTLTPDAFRRKLAPARSFGFVADAERLWAQGLALGASLDNSVILDGDSVLNPEGLRFADEFARHKMLDVVGDLALAGAPIRGAFRSYRGGHALNAALVEKMMTSAAVEWRGATPRKTQAAGIDFCHNLA